MSQFDERKAKRKERGKEPVIGEIRNLSESIDKLRGGARKGSPQGAHGTVS